MLSLKQPLTIVPLPESRRRFEVKVGGALLQRSLWKARFA